MSNTRKNKGSSLLKLPDSYTVVDIETTGLDPRYDEIIEIGAIKIVDNVIKSTFTQLIKPIDIDKVDGFITELTGINRHMLKAAPFFLTVEQDFFNFIRDDVIIGHNVNFDINFLYDISQGKLINNFVDTLRIARRVLPDLKHHRLDDLTKYYKIKDRGLHRALNDCHLTYQIFCQLKKDAPDDWLKSSTYKSTTLDAKTITSSVDDFDEDNPFFGKNCVFTGTLSTMTRKEAMQIVADLGGTPQNNVVSNTNFLIIGIQDYKVIKDGKSSKHKKAERLQLKGADIQIISENVFFDLAFNK